MAKNIVRLFVEHPLGSGQSVPLTQPQAHYLFGVMRLGVGDMILIFNGQDGEFSATIAQTAKRRGMLLCGAQTKPLQMPPDLWLCFAPIKKARTDFIVEKATEMGAARICPVQTDFTNADRIRQDRLKAHAVEAAEQCGGTFVPVVNNMTRFDAVMKDWDNKRRILFCDESLTHLPSALTGKDAESMTPWAIFIGPEGGFSERERTHLRDMPGTISVSLGPRILRADTAAVAAMTLWQKMLGDWT